jgi:hypothetical protein
MNLSNLIFTMRRFIETVNTLKAMEDLSDRWFQSQRATVVGPQLVFSNS